MSRLRQLKSKKTAAVEKMRAITAVSDAENRDLTESENSELDKLANEIDQLNASIIVEEKILAEEKAIGASFDNKLSGRVIKENIEDDPKRGFSSFGEFATAVQSNAINGGYDNRLTVLGAAAGTYGNESSGVDGGFLVPPQFATEIFELSLEEDSLLAETDIAYVEGNGLVLPKDETTPWGTDGIRAYWQSEASQALATKPKLGQVTFRLSKLFALVPITEELLDDSTALSSYLPSRLARSIRWKTDEALLNGLGNGMPMGALQSKSLVVVAKDSNQQPGTISLNNLTTMLARLPAGSFRNAFWMVCPDALPSIFGLTLGNYPIWLPTNEGAKSNPYGMLLGRPIKVSQHSSAFSSQGDISLLDMTYMQTILKRGRDGITIDTSMHLYFDAGETAFRATFRVDSKPKLSSPISQQNSANKLSSFVVLGAR